MPTKIKMAHVTSVRPFQRWFVTCGIGLATINLPTTFELSICTHYEDIKGDTKCLKWSGMG